MQFYFYSTDSASFLEFSQIEFWSKKTLGLSKNSSDNIGFLNDTLNLELCVYNVLYRKCLGYSRKFAPPVKLVLS